MKALTTMQAAYWVGRQSNTPLGGVSAHLYAEFDGSHLNVGRFQQAVSLLFQRHAALRLRIHAEGQQSIDEFATHHRLHIDDWRQRDRHDLTEMLQRKRLKKSTQLLALEQGITSDFSLSLLPDKHHRFHLDVDMIACDAMGFRRLIEDLAALYAGETRITPPEWFDYLAARDADSSRVTRRQQAQRWWRHRIPHIPPAPRPLRVPDRCQSDRIALQLSARESASLSRLAASQHLTLSALFLALFAISVGYGWNMAQFRLNVPLFHRDPLLPDSDKVVGDFSNLVLLTVELDPQASIAHFAQRLMVQLAELISHADYEGVSVTRDLSRLHGDVQSTPVVFTAGFGIEGKALFSQAARQTLGELSWVISQGPEVMLDAQVAHVADGILLNWDVRRDAFPPGLPDRLFATYRALLRNVAWHPENLMLTLPQLLAISTPEAQAQQQPVVEVLCQLLARTQPCATPTPDAEITTLNLSENALSALFDVIAKYLGVRLEPQICLTHPTPHALATQICQHTPDAARRAATLLKVLAEQA